MGSSAAGSTLQPGTTLLPGAFLLSPDHQYELVMQSSDGNLVLYHEGKALWSTGAQGAGTYAAMQTDGNLVLYNSGSARWSSNTASFSGAYLQVQDDGNVVIYQDGHPIWDPASGYIGQLLNPGTTLRSGAFLLSPDHQYELVMQSSDGNLVLYHEGNALWSSGAEGAGAYAAMQSDGNLVIYNGGTARWSSNTASFSGAYLQLQDDGNLVVYQSSHPLWDWSAGYIGDRMTAGVTLTPGEELDSADHDFRLIMQGDGNLVLYEGGKALWSSGTDGNPGATVTMQGDGNLVVYDNGAAKWNSGTAGSSGAYLLLQDDNNLVIYQGSKAIWDWRSGKLSGGSSGGEAIVSAAASQADVPYCEDGGSIDGPTPCGGLPAAFDCSGLAMYAVYQGTGGRVVLPHGAGMDHVAGGVSVSRANLSPGDLVFFGPPYNGADFHHVGIYAGNGMMWDANTAFWIYPDGVHERTLASIETELKFDGAVRYWQ